MFITMTTEQVRRAGANAPARCCADQRLAQRRMLGQTQIIVAGEVQQPATVDPHLRAVDRFDPEQGVTFATFASRTMDGELKRTLRDKAWAVRPPRAAQERHLALRKREEELTHRLGRPPTISELANALDATVEQVLEAVEAGGARTAGGITRTNDDGSVVDADDLLSVNEIGYGRTDDRILVAELLDQLDERSREVIQLRFFERLGQDEIAQRIGVSQSYLSRLLRKILLDLRSHLGELADDFDLEGDEPAPK